MRHWLTGLWRHPDFLTLWAGQTISILGSQITLLALPLMATLLLQATPAQMALLRAAQYLPAVLFGLVAGAWVDRLRRRPLLIGADVGSALALFALPIATILGWLRMPVLYGVAFLLGLLSVVFGTAYAAFLPAVVGHEHLVEGNSKLATSDAVARIAGPGLAGVLIQVLTAPLALAIDGVSFLLSALALSTLRTPEPPPARAARRAIWREIGAGLRTLGGTPALRALALSSATLDLFWNALFTLYVLYVTRTLGLAPSALGLIFGLGSGGALLGALVARRIARRLGVGATLIGAQFLVGAGSLLIALSVGMPRAALPLLLAAELVQSCVGTIYGITRSSLTQAVTPDQLRGRVNASARFIGLGVTAAGSLLGGILGEALGVSATIVVTAVGGLLAFLWLLVAPIRTLRELPPAAERPRDHTY